MLIAKSCDLANSNSYLEMGKQALGPNFGKLVQIILIIYACGVCISQSVLLGDFLVESPTGLLHHWFPNSFLFTSIASIPRRLLVVGGCGVFIEFPLALLRKLDALKFTSSVSLICITFSVFLMVYTYASQSKSEYSQAATSPIAIHWFEFPVSAFAAVPIMNVAFTAHYNSPRFYKVNFVLFPLLVCGGSTH